MSESDSEDSLMDYLPAAKKKKAEPTHSSSSNSSKKASPGITFTGSSQQPVALGGDSDSESSSSVLEVLPPKKKKSVSPKRHPLAPVARLPAAAKKSPPPASVAAAAAKKPALLEDQDSDSDDSLLNTPALKIAPRTKTNSTTSTANAAKATAQKPKAKSTTTSTTTATKPDKAAQKQAEQARKKAERQALKEQKQLEKEAAKESKKRQRLEQQAARGNFATQEIVLLVDPPLFRNTSNNSSYDWRQHDEMTKHNPMVQEYRSALGGSTCQAMQWIRRDHLAGGAAGAWEQLRQNNVQGYQHLDTLIIVMDDPKFFLRMLHRSDEDDQDDDYPQLRQWLLRLEHGWKAAWPQTSSTTARPKILILLHRPRQELDRQWVEFRQTYKNSHVHMAASMQPPNAEAFHDAMTWLLIQYQVECMCCDSYEEIWTAGLKMTRALAKAPYHHPISELECLKKVKPQVKPTDPPLARAKDVWLRQLQQVPRISEIKARRLMQHYPTLQSLWQAYQESDNPEELVAGMLSEGRWEQKLSEGLYKLLTSTNPDEFPM